MAIQPVTIPNFYGGISQKSERLRRLNQFEDVLNCDVSLEDGIYKRNPSLYVSSLEMDVSANNAYIHTFIKSEDEHYFMVMDGSAVKIYDNSGVERSIKYGSLDASNYFSGTGAPISNPRDVFRTVTIGDGVVVARNDVTTRLSPDLTDPADGSVAYLFVKQAQFGWIPLRWWFNLSGEAYYGQVTTAKDAGTVKAVRDADGWWSKLGINTEALAIYIMKTINNEPGPNDITLPGATEEAHQNWANTDVSAIKSIGSVVKVFTTDGAPFENWNVTDGLGDDALILMWKTANTLDDLPLRMPDETPIIRIVGNRADLSDDFYVRYIKDAFSLEKQLNLSSLETGTYNTAAADPDTPYDYSGIDVTLDDLGAWRECAGFSLKYKFDTATMPHIIVQRPDGSFLVNKMDGDAFSVNNDPSLDNTSNFFSDGPNGWLTFSGGATHDFVAGDRVQFSYISGTQYTAEEQQVSATFPSSILPNREYYVKEIDGNTKIKISETPVSDTITYTTLTGTYFPVVNVVAKTYKQFKYAVRESGDDITNPVPSFVDNSINDVVLHRNRLAFVSKDAVTLSEFGEFFNFFRITVQEVLDTAPIEVQTTDNITRELVNAVSYKNTLLVFSKEGQFALVGEPGLTPESVNFTLATAYRSNTKTRPFVLGDRLYFFENRRDSQLMHEIVEREFKGNYVSRDVTEEVPRLITGNIQTVTNNGQDTMALVTDNDLSEIITYTVKVDQTRGLISAWHRYTLEDIEVEHLKYIDNILSIVGLYQGKHRMLLTIDKDPLFDETYLDVKLTSGVLAAGTYDSATDTTEYTIPFVTETTGWVAVDEDNKQSINFSGIEPTKFVVETDTTARNIVFGKNFTSQIAFSRFYPQSRQGQGPVVNDQLILDEFLVAFDKNNFQTFDMSSVNTNGKSYVKTYASNILNTQSLGAYENPVDFAQCFVQARNRDVRLYITNDAYVPFNLINYEYSISEGQKRHTR